MPQSAKSRPLRVARRAPRDRTIAAICASIWLIGFPFSFRPAAISRKARAASVSKGRTRPARSTENIGRAANRRWETLFARSR